MNRSKNKGMNQIIGLDKVSMFGSLFPELINDKEAYSSFIMPSFSLSSPLMISFNLSMLLMHLFSIMNEYDSGFNFRRLKICSFLLRSIDLQILVNQPVFDIGNYKHDYQKERRG